MNKGDNIYYARVVPKVGLFDLLDLTVRSISEDNSWFVAVDIKTKQSFLFSMGEEDERWFRHRNDALDVVTKAKDKYGGIKLTKVKDEEE